MISGKYWDIKNELLEEVKNAPESITELWTSDYELLQSGTAFLRNNTPMKIICKYDSHNGLEIFKALKNGKPSKNVLEPIRYDKDYDTGMFICKTESEATKHYNDQVWARIKGYERDIRNIQYEIDKVREHFYKSDVVMETLVRAQ